MSDGRPQQADSSEQNELTGGGVRNKCAADVATILHPFPMNVGGCFVASRQSRFQTFARRRDAKNSATAGQQFAAWAALCCRMKNHDAIALSRLVKAIDLRANLRFCGITTCREHHTG